MSGILSLAGLSPKIVIPAVIVLGIFAALFVVGGVTGGIVLWRKRKATKNVASSVPAASVSSKPRDILGTLGTLSASPLVHEVLKVVLPAVHEAQQFAVNAAVAKMFPALSPFIPGIDKAVAGVDTIIENKLGIGDAATPARIAPLSPPALPSIVVPPGHPVLDLLRQTLEAHRERQQARDGAENKAA